MLKVKVMGLTFSIIFVNYNNAESRGAMERASGM